MKYTTPCHFIDTRQFDYIISIGNKCPTAMILRELGVYGESFPFDYVPTTPSLILSYLKDNTAFFPQQGEIRTRDGVWFGHFNVTDRYDQTIETFKRRFNRLYDVLRSNKRVLFVYTSEADLTNELGNRDRDNYAALLELQHYLQSTYSCPFTIMAIHTNKKYPNTDHIINYTIHVESHYLSNDGIERPNVWNQYRILLRLYMQRIFRL